MTTLWLVYLCLLHFVADFLLQSREMGKKKSSEPIWLAKHIGIIFIVFLLGTSNWLFALLNAAVHAGIDASIWNLYKFGVKKRVEAGVLEFDTPENFQYWEDHWFYATIGFDQFLHTITIILLVGALY